MKLQRGWRERAAEVLRTFCGEAAVLLLVFPLLDRFTQNPYGLSWRLVAGSVGASFFFLSLALLIAALVRKEEE